MNSPVTKFYFIKKADGEVATYDDAANPITLVLFVSEMSDTKDYSGLILTNEGTDTEKFEAGGEFVSADLAAKSVTLKITKSGAYGVTSVDKKKVDDIVDNPKE